MTPDAHPTWVDWLPARAQAYARLARFDRPAGTWLLFWPCLMGLALAQDRQALLLAPWFFAGAVAMRAAGCVYNDIVDRDLDRSVARTASRPIASGEIGLGAGWALLVALSLVGFLVLLQLPRLAQGIALASLALVAVYPFMKRITWWPQLWLGLTFNWGVAVGWATSEERAPLGILLLVQAALLFWTLAYDSIYAAQDREDDALAGIKSSARALGDRLQAGVGLFAALTILFMGAAILLLRREPLLLLGLVPAALHLGWQAATFNPDEPGNALTRFRANSLTGLLLAGALLLTLPWVGA